VNINFSRIALYVANIAFVVLLAFLISPSEKVVGVYYALAFWTLVVLDATRCRLEDNAFADRFIGYLFAAPFILIARGAELVPVRARS
jgi:hypothetical protein